MPTAARDVFVISDLHIGGRPGADGGRGFCINTHVPLLAEFVRRVAARKQRTGGAVELVINGDFIDFLAHESPRSPDAGAAEVRRWSAFIADPDAALDAFRSIRAANAVLFDALHDLVAGGADLTLLLGNHDLELSLPPVRSELLAGLEHPGGGRVRFVYDGEALAFGEVLIEHGNRYDAFNVVDHDRLRRLRSSLSRGQAPRDDGGRFAPPLGSRLVEQVMNPIKVDYGFVDLLKPETGAVIPLLLALEPGLAGDLRRLGRLASLKAQAVLDAPGPAEPARPEQIGLAGRDAGITDGDGTGGDPLNGLLGTALSPADRQAFIALADAAAPALDASPIGLADDARAAWSLLKQKAAGAAWDTRMRVLQTALRRLQGDASFSTDAGLGDMEAHLRQLGRGGFRVIVFGHTHLAKSVALPGGPTYLNTGTWADLMRLPPALFDADAGVARTALDRFVDDLRQRHYAPYLVFEPHFAHLHLDGDGRVATARLDTFSPESALP